MFPPGVRPHPIRNRNRYDTRQQAATAHPRSLDKVYRQALHSARKRYSCSMVATFFFLPPKIDEESPRTFVGAITGDRYLCRSFVRFLEFSQKVQDRLKNVDISNAATIMGRLRGPVNQFPERDAYVFLVHCVVPLCGTGTSRYRTAFTGICLFAFHFSYHSMV